MDVSPSLSLAASAVCVSAGFWHLNSEAPEWVTLLHASLALAWWTATLLVLRLSPSRGPKVVSLVRLLLRRRLFDRWPLKLAILAVLGGIAALFYDYLCRFG